VFYCVCVRAALSLNLSNPIGLGDLSAGTRKEKERASLQKPHGIAPEDAPKGAGVYM